MIKQIVVAVASKSKPKIEAAQAGFARVLPEGVALEVVASEVSSGVADQPIGFDETREGARKRLAAVRATETGGAADFCIAFEGGVEIDAFGKKVCFAVICSQYRDDDFISEVRSATHSLPPGIETYLDQGLELGLATDKFFASLTAGYGKSSGGTIGALTNGAVDRVDYYAHPAALSLVPFINAMADGINTANPLYRGHAAVAS
eukprot:TRINITY_DN79960_c0_g1_i1.p1 TRINITY_DN79960_c0_g1~~TRINITY_DN79960_c0_g1_i1.p1  ORF type:complete len:205 (+),score=37.12 TRINITY_DN79960_c0_g1_i1:39-653(+)